jgi:polyhydroxybutyrate depolymerase
LASPLLAPAQPCSPGPTLCARLLTNGLLELRWESCTNSAYQLEGSVTLTNWRVASPPLPAPAKAGWVTNTQPALSNYTFYRLRADALTNSPVPTTPGGHRDLFFTHGGVPRTFNLVLPTKYDPAVATPLALILHGGGQTADSFAVQHPGLFASAQTNNIILVLPDGVEDVRGTGWNNFEQPGVTRPDDVAFLLALIDHLGSTLNLDRRRIYAGGFSAGGVMCHYLGARTTNVFAALAAVEAAIGADRGTGSIITNPPATGPMPVFILNCTNSCARPYWGGPNDDGNLMTAAIDAAYYWTNANLCAAVMTATTNNIVTSNIDRFNPCGSKPPPNQLQPNQVIILRWTNCAPGAEVVFVTLTDGGHIWPDANDNVGFDANREVLRFFLQHSLPVTTPDCFECTQVIGYSQVGAANGWFVKDGIFESFVDSNRWQLIWANGATLRNWQDPGDPVWSSPLQSACANNSAAPDRVLLNLSGNNTNNVAAWVADIDATIETIKLKFPSARRITLQPIVGGPGHQTCDYMGTPVRASVSHPYMDKAIALVVAARAGTQPEVVAGISAEVTVCSDYDDATGHFTDAGAIAAAQAIGQYYATLDAGCAMNAPGR